MKNFVSKYTEGEYDILKNSGLLNKVIPTASGDYFKDLLKEEQNLTTNDLKCCGNCRSFDENCYTKHYSVCKKWKFDGYGFEGRDIEKLQ